MKKIMFVLLAVALTINCQAKKVTLELNLKKGEVYTQAIQTNMNMAMNMMGQNIDLNMIVGGHMSYKVADAEDTLYNLDVCYDSLFMKINVMNKSMDFNSEKMAGVNDMLSKMMNTMKNKTFNIKLSKSGRTFEVTNIDSIFSDFFKMAPTMSEEQKSQMKAQMEKSFGEKSFKSTNFQTFNIFPEKPVNIGDKWTKYCSMVSSDINFDISTTYELKEVTKDYFKVSGISQVVNDSSSTMKLNGMELKLNLSGGIVSDLKINRKTGWIIESLGKQEMNADVKSVGNMNGQVPPDMSINIKMAGDIVVKE